MKTAVVYATRTGSTQLCAEYIASKLSDCSLFNLEKSTPDLSEYDVIFIGSGVRMGNFYKPIKKLLSTNAKILSGKKTVLFLSNFYPNTLSKTIQKNVPEELLNSADVLTCGGKAPFSISLNIDWLKRDLIDHFLSEHQPV